ncbi:TrbC/VirB2 family protein [Enterobacter ludwigii]
MFKALQNIRHLYLKLAVSLIVLAPALASASSSTGMPWEDPLSKVVDSVTGPVAFGIAVIGVVVAGMTLVFGGQLDGFIQKIAILALVVALIVMATNVMSSLFGTSSTVIAMAAMGGLPVA